MVLVVVVVVVVVVAAAEVARVSNGGPRVVTAHTSDRVARRFAFLPAVRKQCAPWATGRGSRAAVRWRMGGHASVCVCATGPGQHELSASEGRRSEPDGTERRAT